MRNNEVTKEEFDKFIKEYPRKLEANFVTICEPPLMTYNDFSIAEYPNSIVASFYDDWLDNDKRHYFIEKGGLDLFLI